MLGKHLYSGCTEFDLRRPDKTHRHLAAIGEFAFDVKAAHLSAVSIAAYRYIKQTKMHNRIIQQTFCQQYQTGTGSHYRQTVPDAALAIVDNLNRRDWTAVELATSLSAENRDRHLVYLSGAGLSPEGVLEQIQMAENAGIRNLVPVSGEVPEKLRSARECRKMPFTESTDILRLLAQRKKDFIVKFYEN